MASLKCFYRVGLLMLGVGMASLASAFAQPSIPAMGNRAVAVVAATPDYTFHSDFWLNLHHYLYGIAGGGPDERAGFDAEAVACFEALPEEQAAAWQAAEAYYHEHMGERHHRTDPLMRSLRYMMANLAATYDPAPQQADVLALLGDAAPAYRACLWEMHDQRNRKRIAELIGLLAVYGPALQAELSRHYQEAWPEALMVDVASYSDFAGMNTASGRTIPSHMMLASTEPDLEAFKGLEMVLHEATHAIFGARWGTVTEHLLAACEALGVDPPRNLWHALSFYTAGEVVARVARAAGDESFEPYAKRTGMFDRPYRGYLEPIEQHWQPYLDGAVDLPTALSNVVAVISGAKSN